MYAWLILIVLAVLAALALLVARADIPPADPDPLFIAGIALAGVSAGLIAILGTAATPMAVVGIACIAVGARRSRARHS